MNIYELGLFIEGDLGDPQRIGAEEDVTMSYLKDMHYKNPIAEELSKLSDEQKTILLECFNIIVKWGTLDDGDTEVWSCSWFKNPKKFKRKVKYQEAYENRRAESVVTS